MARYRVLIVDDQRDIRRVLSAGLSTLPMNIDVVDVPSAEEAMLVAHGPFDLMVSDVWLPGISGLDLINRIHKINASMKVMLMTGLSDPEIREKVERAGAEAFFYKPVDLDQFLNAVVKALSGSTAPDEIETAAGQQLDAIGTPLPLLDRLEELRQKAVMGLAAVLEVDGKVVAQSGFLQDVYNQDDLSVEFTHLHTIGIELSSLLESPDPDNLFYIAGSKYHFLAASINPDYLLVLTSEQPFQHKLSQLNQWLSEAIRGLDRILVGIQLDHSLAAGGEDEIQQVSEELVSENEVEQITLRSLEEELAGVEITEEDKAAVDALFDQADRKKVEHTDIDQFWDNLVEESESPHIGEGMISYDDAVDMGLAPD